jgi:hypothetical protein
MDQAFTDSHGHDVRTEVCPLRNMLDKGVCVVQRKVPHQARVSQRRGDEPLRSDGQRTRLAEVLQLQGCSRVEGRLQPHDMVSVINPVP